MKVGIETGRVKGTPHNVRYVLLICGRQSEVLYSRIPEGRAIVAVDAIKKAFEAVGISVVLGEKP